MKVTKKINNNVALAINDNNEEVFIVGKGVGFKQVPYDLPNDSEIIEKVFIALDRSPTTLMFEQIPTKLILFTQNLIEYTEERLCRKLQPRLLLTLSDHIHYTLERYRDNLEIKNLIGFEIKHIYPKEFAVANECVEKINETYGIQLPNSEAAFIAIHFVNAQTEEGINPKISLTDILSDVTALVKYQFNIDIEQDVFNYERFVTHLRLLIERQLASVKTVAENKQLYEIATKKYPEEADCVDNITKLLKDSYNLKSNQDEKLYLLLHIRRLTQRTSTTT